MPRLTSEERAAKIRRAKETLRKYDVAPADRTPEEQAIIARTVCIDFDDTLAVSLWSPINPTHDIGEPIQENVDKTKQLIVDGWHVVVYTARGWEDEEAIAKWCADQELPILRVECGKPIAMMYVDDRAVHESNDEWVVPTHVTANLYRISV